MGRNAQNLTKQPWYGAYSRQLRSVHRRTLFEETTGCMRHLQILQAWQDQLRTLLGQALGAVQQRCEDGSLHQIESDIQTLASVSHWAKKERQRQLEGLSFLWKLLYGEWKPEKVQMPFLVPQEMRVSKYTVEMLQQLVRQLVGMATHDVRSKHGPRPPSTPPPPHLLKARLQAEVAPSAGLAEQSGPTESFPEELLESVEPEEPKAPDFELQQQEFEHQKHQLQQELAAILQRREAFGQRTCGMELLQELERVHTMEPGSQQCQELQDQLQHEVHMSQQQQLCQQMLQQLELEMELQRQELSMSSQAVEQRTACASSNDAPVKQDHAEFQHCLHQIMEQLGHLEQLTEDAGIPDVDLEEQRQMLWTYLQAELESPQPESSKRLDKGRCFGKGPVWHQYLLTCLIHLALQVARLSGSTCSAQDGLPVKKGFPGLVSCCRRSWEDDVIHRSIRPFCHPLQRHHLRPLCRPSRAAKMLTSSGLLAGFLWISVALTPGHKSVALLAGAAFSKLEMRHGFRGCLLVDSFWS